VETACRWRPKISSMAFLRSVYILGTTFYIAYTSIQSYISKALKTHKTTLHAGSAALQSAISIQQLYSVAAVRPNQNQMSNSFFRFARNSRDTLMQKRWGAHARVCSGRAVAKTSGYILINKLGPSRPRDRLRPQTSRHILDLCTWPQWLTFHQVPSSSTDLRDFFSGCKQSVSIVIYHVYTIIHTLHIYPRTVRHNPLLHTVILKYMRSRREWGEMGARLEGRRFGLNRSTPIIKCRQCSLALFLSLSEKKKTRRRCIQGVDIYTTWNVYHVFYIIIIQYILYTVSQTNEALGLFM